MINMVAGVHATPSITEQLGIFWESVAIQFKLQIVLGRTCDVDEG